MPCRFLRSVSGNWDPFKGMQYLSHIRLSGWSITNNQQIMKENHLGFLGLSIWGFRKTLNLKFLVKGVKGLGLDILKKRGNQSDVKGLF